MVFIGGNKQYKFVQAYAHSVGFWRLVCPEGRTLEICHETEKHFSYLQNVVKLLNLAMVA